MNADLHDRFTRLSAVVQENLVHDVSDTELLDRSLYSSVGSARKEEGEQEEDREVDSVLVFVSTSQCESCDPAWSGWKSEGGSAIHDNRLEAWHVELVENDTRLATSRLPPHDDLGPIRMLRPVNTAAYLARTGVDFVPTAFLVHKPGRVVCVVGGVPTPEQVDRCLARTTDKGTAFIWNRDTMEPTFLPPVETPVQK